MPPSSLSVENAGYAAPTPQANQPRSGAPTARANARGKRKTAAVETQGRPNDQDTSGAEGAGPSRRRKERDPNWSREEIMALVEAKRLEHLEEMEVIDARDLMSTDVTKWGKIALEVNAITGGGVIREGPACKHKWTSTMSDFKRIADYHKGTGRNEEEYYLMTFGDRRKENLPRSFYKEVYSSMYEFFQSRPMMNPPHSRDLLRPQDGNYGFSKIRNSASEVHGDFHDHGEINSQPGSPYFSDSLGDSTEVQPQWPPKDSRPDVSHWSSGPWSSPQQGTAKVGTEDMHTASTHTVRGPPRSPTAPTA